MSASVNINLGRMIDVRDLVTRLQAERDEAQMEYADALIARDVAIRRAEVAEADAARWKAAYDDAVVSGERGQP